MGIDVYLRWDEQTGEEAKAQITGFSIDHGYTGYLREAYHGSPYATHALVTEDWGEQPDDGFEIANSDLQNRMPEVIADAIERSRVIYKTEATKDSECVKSFIDFVKLHRIKEEAGLHPKIIISY